MLRVKSYIGSFFMALDNETNSLAIDLIGFLQNKFGLLKQVYIHLSYQIRIVQ